MWYSIQIRVQDSSQHCPVGPVTKDADAVVQCKERQVRALLVLEIDGLKMSG